MKALFNSVLLATLLASCNNPSKQDPKLHTTMDTTRKAVETEDPHNSISAKAIELKSIWDSIQLRKMSKESDTISFVSSGFKQIDAVLSSEKAGNIRFNQIILPDDHSDGPFGKDLQYPLDKKGAYKLIIGESLMQGDPFDGQYTLKFKGQ